MTATAQMALGLPATVPPLPDRLPCLAFWQPFIYKPDLWAWCCERPRRLKRPLAREQAGLTAPPQGLVYADGRAVREALGDG